MDDDYAQGFVDALIMFAPLPVATAAIVAITACWYFGWWPF